jgi:hypothetical protein
VPGDGTLRLGAKCLDARGGLKTAGTVVQVYSCNGTGAQTWMWAADDTIRNPQSALCVAVVGGSAAPGTGLDLATCSATAAQRWNLPAVTPTGAITGLGGLCLDVRGNSTANGTTFQLAACAAAAGELMQLPGNGTLHALGKCLGVVSAGTKSGTLVDLYTCDGGTAQQWTPGAAVSLVNPHSGKCLDVPGGTITPGVALQISTCNGGAGQKWSLPL